MNAVGQREILTQQRVVEFFQDALGYAYLRAHEQSGAIDRAAWRSKTGEKLASMFPARSALSSSPSMTL